jgi:hypothetical protein
MEDIDVIHKMMEWQIHVIEKANSTFSNMPVCPFAKKARTDKKIRWEILKFEIKNDLNQIMSFLRDFNPRIHNTMISESTQ